MEKRFSIGMNLKKAGEAFLVGAIPAALVCLEDAATKGELDLKKVTIGFGLSVTLAGIRSLLNYQKNRNPRKARARK